MQKNMIKEVQMVILQNGTQLIAQIDPGTDNELDVNLERPCIFVLEDPPDIFQLDNKKAFNVSLYPWVPLAKGMTIKIKRSSVLAFAQPVEGLEKMYRETVMKEDVKDGK